MAGDKKPLTSLAMRFDAKGNPASRRNVNTVNQKEYVEARILWPALGFPAVVSPTSGGEELPTRDPTRCIYVLLLTNKQTLHKGDVARHLRYVPWAQRHTRWLPTVDDGGKNAFAETDMDIPHEPRLLSKRKRGDLSQVCYFAADRGGENGFMVTLSEFVRKFYWRRGLCYLREIHILEPAAARLQPGLYHLFWVNENTQHTSKNRSAEFQHLVGRGFAKQSRFGHDGVPTWKELKKTQSGRKFARRVMREYAWDFRRPRTLDNRTEVLHPLFIQENRTKLKIGHLTDLHVSIRADAYEDNLKNEGFVSKLLPGHWSGFHNWNHAFRALYAKASKSCDILLLTGDLIDYGRGYSERQSKPGEKTRATGAPAKAVGPVSLGRDSAYWRDRIWFLFYAMIASGTNYKKPVYTILGNHDWRINPYPPFAPGSPSPGDMHLNEEYLKIAHGPGHETGHYYTDRAGVLKLFEKGGKVAAGFKHLHIDYILDGIAFWRKSRFRDGALEIDGTPLETSVASVKWYLLLINPFLDYTYALPGGYDFLMLDWAENELVEFETVKGGRNKGRAFWTITPDTEKGPVASDLVSKNQEFLVGHFMDDKNSAAKVVGIHAPPLGPWPQWPDDELRDGRIEYDRYNRQPSRGQVEGEPWHHVRALQAPEDDPQGQVADYGTFGRKRDDFIKKLHKSKVQLVLSGHIHRSNLLTLWEQRQPLQSIPDLLVKDIPTSRATRAPQPLFVNTTSAGPLGNERPTRYLIRKAKSGYAEVELSNTGKVHKVDFKTY